MIFGDGWCEATQEPPEQLSEQYGENVASFGNGFWASLSDAERKRLGDREDSFIHDLGRLFCSYLKPLKAFQFPVEG